MKTKPHFYHDIDRLQDVIDVIESEIDLLITRRQKTKSINPALKLEDRITTLQNCIEFLKKQVAME